MDTRLNKWRWKRVQADAEKQRFSTMLLKTSEELMKVHSNISANAFDRMMGDPIAQLDTMLGKLKEKSFLKGEKCD